MNTPDRNRPLLWLVALGFFMQALDATILNTALPSIAANLGESPLRMESVVIAYMLTVALLMPASGWLADRFGTRRTYYFAVLVFAIGSFLCAESRQLWQLVAARVVQGIGGALLMPVGRLAVLRVFPGKQLVAALSFVTLPGLVGPLIGPTLGGWLVQAASWHWIFLINLPVGLVGAWAVRRYMPDYVSLDRAPFDWPGYLLLGGGMVMLSLGLQGLGELGFARAWSTLLLVGGLAAIVAYWLHAGRAEEPLFDLALFRVRSFAVGIFGNLFARLGSGAMPFLMPLFLQVGLGFTPLQAGFALVPSALAAMTVKTFAERVLTRWGYRRVLTVNTVLVGAMIASFALLGPATPAWWLALHMACFGAINSMQFTAMNTVTLKDLEGPLASGGNSLLSMTMQLSMSLGVASAAALLSAFSKHFGHPHGADDHTLTVFRATLACVGVLGAVAATVFAQLDDAPPAAEEGTP
ncbi:multidrug transporter subunit MdtD [Chitinimonas koreensis]|uniref:multidrug transporter subunit MdtD n=1 Tax=Chitinimonas koreensis TaxID=356302 RepID=UPI0004273DD1|nr:multidrug transporter subunit MdtD [Chitinimonas koreensis]QNM96042.1 multidrug transporter subunit MdtD [Chitinimonas koreensis]